MSATQCRGRNTPGSIGVPGYLLMPIGVAFMSATGCFIGICGIRYGHNSAPELPARDARRALQPAGWQDQKYGVPERQLSSKATPPPPHRRPPRAEPQHRDCSCSSPAGNSQQTPSYRCYARYSRPALKTTEFTAPMDAASGESLLSSSVMRCLKGWVTLMPAKPADSEADSTAAKRIVRQAPDVEIEKDVSID